mmetsp:Transcript_21022/g.27253  ORF Transcript_21022/g.27253 Transcript_21022/m.27253 type:complete len:380 (-) Transcript_21022:307-1446(-)
MRRPTSRAEVIATNEVHAPSTLRGGRMDAHVSITIDESAEKKAAIPIAKKVDVDQNIHISPYSQQKHGFGFLRDLTVHTCFSMIFVALILAGLRWERESNISTVIRNTILNHDRGQLRGEGLLINKRHSLLEETDEFSLFNESETEAIVSRARREVKALRDRGVIINADPEAEAAITYLQNATKRLLRLRYGPGPSYDLAIRLSFPQSMGGGSGRLLVRTAPIDLMPHAIHVFLDAFVTKALRSDISWKSAFHRRAGHVLQAFVRAPKLQGLAFQEYHPSYPHKKHTLGFAGRPGGPEFYISILDNSKNHGPGSQGSKYGEADSCFATIIDGFDDLQRMKNQPGAQPPNGFIKESTNFIYILGVDILNYDPFHGGHPRH